MIARGIAHDFNNLLGSILADSELLLGDLAGDLPAREGIERIRAVAVRAAEIARELMVYSGQEDKLLEPVDLRRLVDEMLQLMKVSISKRATLQVNLPEKVLAVRGNAAQIRQVVMNLITNASEALGEEGGVISISLAPVQVGPDWRGPDLPEGDYLRLEVGDTGCGMAEAIQARIFDPFFTTKFAGRGLGLAAVQGIIRSHGGTINVWSAPGQGSRFEILLPRIGDTAANARDAMMPAAAGKAGSDAGTVLIVEDEEGLRLAVSKMLRRAGFTTIEAADGVAALDLFRAGASEIDVVLLDLTLPRMSGGEVLAEMRRIAPNGKVIISSAYSHDYVTRAIHGQQPWLYIRKPYHLSELTSLVQSVCSG